MENGRKNKSVLGIMMLILLPIALIVVGIVLAIITAIPALYAVSAVGLVMLIWLIAKYNKMVRYSNKVRESLALIDIQLKQRFDLIPNLVNTVKGYAKHEKELFENVTELRSRAMKTTDKKELIDCANESLPMIGQMCVIAEKYPDLKANGLFKQLMKEMTIIEDKLVAARRFYDSNVNMYNTSIQTFPNNLVAASFGFDYMQLYRIDGGEKMLATIDFDK